MANPEHLKILEQGVEAWNKWREQYGVARVDLDDANLPGAALMDAKFQQANFIEANLRGAFLSGADFFKAKLMKADLQEAYIQGTDFNEVCFNYSNLQGAHLQKSKFINANLFKVNLQGAHLEETAFLESDLNETILREAYLQDANLMEVKGLQASQLAGSNVSGAKLPADIAKFEGLGHIAELSQNAKKLFISMLLGCVYTWLTIATTSDVRLLTNSVSSPLPIIGTEIPIVGFYFTAPLLLLSLYVWLNLYLQRLWKGLSELPAFFPDGKALDEKVYPWLVIGFVLSHVKLLKCRRPPLSAIENGISIFLTWWLVPLTLLFLWGRYLTRHHWPITAFHILLFGLTAWFGITFYELAKATLQGTDLSVFSWKSFLEKVMGYKNKVVQIALGIIFLLSMGAIYSSYSWTPIAFSWINFMPFADLIKEDISVKPPNWTGLERNLEEEISLVKGAKLHGANLRYANLSDTFLINADLEKADLQGAVLERGDLREANLRDANLAKANLQNAELQNSNFLGANLVGSDLGYANLKGADLTFADFEGAYLRGANLQEAILGGTDLIGTNLREVKLQKAKLKGAHMQKANLTGANLQEAIFTRNEWAFGKGKGLTNLQDAIMRNINLQEANLAGANLSGAILAGANLAVANLAEANLQGANLAGDDNVPMFNFDGLNPMGANLAGANLAEANLQRAQLRGVDLTEVKNFTQAQLDQTCVDEVTKLPGGLTRPELCKEKEEKLRKN